MDGGQLEAGTTEPVETVAGTHRFRWGARTYVMAILNVTPDSFSGDGVGSSLAGAIDRAAWAVSSGADILDVGGESTRPGADVVTVEEEIERVVPVVGALAERFDLPISVDTYKAIVAEAALDAGADLVNDVWGLRLDPDMAPLVARRGVPAIIMHNRSDMARVARHADLGTWYTEIEYGDLLSDVATELVASVEIALRAGVERSKIILDPGIGFGKTVSQNLRLIDGIGKLRRLGYPLLIGPSRKSFIGKTLGLPPEERLEGTAAAVAIGIARGADIVRVHDVGFMSRVARMADALVRPSSEDREL